ncbi:PREDICTED: uncharacterized protein LOC104799740 [Tarenaya hassleriana]|uniref:uncharacterized protein LOC104799740 n=1 Tax=Tarenaya hassleriana TaxID=28532 RepID=UPI00053CA2AD|nr:PREDICTED: uncharacterized protein LOC104799740 [Tarenaya hassleriana]
MGNQSYYCRPNQSKPFDQPKQISTVALLIPLPGEKPTDWNLRSPEPSGSFLVFPQFRVRVNNKIPSSVSGRVSPRRLLHTSFQKSDLGFCIDRSCRSGWFDAGDDEDNEVLVGGGGGGGVGDEDDEANENLSLKILEKSLPRRAVKRSRSELRFDDSNETIMADLCVSSSSILSPVLVNGDRSMLKKKSIVRKDEDEVETVEEVTKDEEGGKSVELNAGEGTSNNMVLRMLLRRPRYFNAPKGVCGEEGNMTINRPSRKKRKKPCFVCGSLEHGGKQCAKAQECNICKQVGHHAKNCPDKNKSGSRNMAICLRCGESGHDMFSCKYEYSQDDLKDIQCYVCKAFGHLCCVDPSNSPRWAVSCYRCGQPGHTGLACGKPNEGRTKRDAPGSCFRCGKEGHYSRECLNPYILDSAISCYRCRGIGHIARDCPVSTPVVKRTRDTSMPSRKPQKKTKGNEEYHSAPHELNGKTKKRKRKRNLKSLEKAKNSGGWATEYPEEGDTSSRKRKCRNLRSPVGPSPLGVNHWISAFSSGGCPPSPPFSRIPISSHHGNATSATGFGDRHYCYDELPPSCLSYRIPFPSHHGNAASASRISDRHYCYDELPPSCPSYRIPFPSHHGNAASTSRISDRHYCYDEWPSSCPSCRNTFPSHHGNAASASRISDRHRCYDEWPPSCPTCRIPFPSHHGNAALAPRFSDHHYCYDEWQPSSFSRIPFPSHHGYADSVSMFSDRHYCYDEWQPSSFSRIPFPPHHGYADSALMFSDRHYCYDEYQW